jgi:hypothetical protein
MLALGWFTRALLRRAVSVSVTLSAYSLSRFRFVLLGGLLATVLIGFGPSVPDARLRLVSGKLIPLPPSLFPALGMAGY